MHINRRAKPSKTHKNKSKNGLKRAKIWEIYLRINTKY